MVCSPRYSLVVALLAALPVLAQEPPTAEPDELIDWRAIDKHLEGHRLEREALEREAGLTPARPKFTLDLETIGGRAEGVAASSSLITARYRPARTLSFGAAIPFAIGAGPGGAVSYGQAGALALFSTLEPTYGPNTTFHLGLLVTLPTVAGVGQGRDGVEPLSATSLASNARVIARTRGFEDDELFLPATVSIVPRLGMTQRLGPVDASLAVKLPIMLREELTSDVVVSTQVMARVFERRGALLSVGARAFVWPQWTSTMYGMSPVLAAGAAVEPRVEARFGAFGARAGFVMPLDGFPSTWGLRVGVGASF